jgi:hypothetical protein
MKRLSLVHIRSPLLSNIFRRVAVAGQDVDDQPIEPVWHAARRKATTRVVRAEPAGNGRETDEPYNYINTIDILD